MLRRVRRVLLARRLKGVPVKAFVTGSRVYGAPTRKSDIDLVVMTTPAQIEALRELADADDPLHKPTEWSDPGPMDDVGGLTASLKFGNLNLICVTGHIGYGVWLTGTKELAKLAADRGRPVTRDEAVLHFRALREKHGLRRKPRD